LFPPTRVRRGDPARLNGILTVEERMERGKCAGGGMHMGKPGEEKFRLSHLVRAKKKDGDEPKVLR